jgi:plastocyanin
VTIGGFEYKPPNITVKAGETVVWTNNDLLPHTVTAGRAFDSGEIPPQRAWRFVAKKRGVFPYICTYHPTMKGTLTVE